MKYVIEIVSATSEDVLSRAVVESNDLAGAEGRTIPLLEIWAKQGATRARVMTLEGSVVAEIASSPVRRA